MKSRLLFLAIAFALLGFVYYVSPDIKFPMIIHKLTLVSLAGVLGYFLDVILFPRFRPHKMLIDSMPPLIIAATLIRRAIIMMAVILGVTMGI
jgi:amino acid transporter